MNQRPDFDKLSQALDSNLRDRIESIYDFEKEFEKLVELSGVDLLVVFIDDLDRCKKDATLHILEAMKLFLYSRKCIYVLGLDHEKICEAIKTKFPGDVAEEYLDKIVQLPFFIPRTKLGSMLKFLKFLVISQYVGNEKDLEELAGKVRDLKEDQFEIGVRTKTVFDMNKKQFKQYNDIIKQQELIIEENDYNPRRIKKFLNTYFMRLYLKENLSLKLENEYIAKFLLLQLKHESFHKDLERYPNLLKEMQLLSSIDEEERKKELGKSDLLRNHFENKKLISFLERMEFGEVNSRPYLLLSETGTFLVLSIDEVEVMEDLLSSDSVRVHNSVERFSQFREEKKEYFLKMILQDTHGIIEGNTVDIVAKMGIPTICPLMCLLGHTNNEDLVKDISEILRRMGSEAVDPLIDLLGKTDDEIVRESVFEILRRMGSEAVDPLIDLLGKTDDEIVRESVFEILRRMGSEAVDPLIDLLGKTDDEIVRESVFEILRRMGSEAVDPLIDLLERTRHDAARGGVSEALGKTKDPKAINRLINVLEKTDSNDLRKTILRIMRRMGSEAVDPLIDLLEKTDDITLKKNISEGLGKTKDPKAVDFLISLLERTKEDDIRGEILKVSIGIGGKAVDPLVCLLEKTDNTELKYEIVETLGKMKDPKAVSLLIDAFEKTDNRNLKESISEALIRSEEMAVDPLIDHLEKECSDDSRKNLSGILARIGEKAVDSLMDLLGKTDSEDLKWRISEALGEIGDPRAVNSLIDFLMQIDNKTKRKSVLAALARIGSEAVNPLIDVLERSDNIEMKWEIVRTLGEIGDSKAVDPLIDLLEKTDSPGLKYRISEALGKIGDPRAVDPLIDLLGKTDDYRLRKDISEALAKIGSEAVNPLIDFLEKSQDDGLKYKISQVLGEIGDPRAVDPLMDLLEKTDSNTVRGSVSKISKALLGIGEDAVDPLIILLERRDNQIVRRSSSSS